MSDAAVAIPMENEDLGEERAPSDPARPAFSELFEHLDVARDDPDQLVIDVAESAPTVDLRDEQDASANDENGEGADPQPSDPRRSAGGGPAGARRTARTRSNDGPLLGRVAVVSGGGGGVGRAIALSLLDAGSRVCLLGRDVGALRETVEMAGRAAAALYLQCDLGSISEIESAADFIGRFDRPVDLLVHAGGVRVPHGISEGSIADLDEQYLVNLRGPYALTQKLMGSLSAGPGHVFLLDRSADPDSATVDVQHASIMSGLRTLAEGIRMELDGTGVRVTTLTVGGGIDDADVATCVVNSARMAPGVEVADLRIRVVPSARPE